GPARGRRQLQSRQRVRRARARPARGQGDLAWPDGSPNRRQGGQRRAGRAPGRKLGRPALRLPTADRLDAGWASRLGQDHDFGQGVGVDGVVLTKLDGDPRGGAALSFRVATGERIRFAGTGEKPSDLEAFHAERMASRILGMGDVLTLIEKAERAVDKDRAAEVERHLRAGQLSFDDFLAQIRQLRGMGSLEGLLEMVPGGGALKGQLAGADTEKEVRKMEAIILSMTPRERAHP